MAKAAKNGPEQAEEKQAPDFETALAELEAIVQNMEGGQLTLEESLAAYRRGSELLQLCQRRLTDAEEQVRVLENGILRPFSAGGDPE